MNLQIVFTYFEFVGTLDMGECVMTVKRLIPASSNWQQFTLMGKQITVLEQMQWIQQNNYPLRIGGILEIAEGTLSLKNCYCNQAIVSGGGKRV